MLREMSYREWRGWVAYARKEPFPSVRQDALSAHMVWAVLTAVGNLEATVVNMFSDSKRHARKWRMEDLILKFGEPDPPQRRQTAKQQWDIIGKMAAALAGDKNYAKVKEALEKGRKAKEAR